MHMGETVTIINNSGKVISTGKQLVNIFKDAKVAYQEKKAALKAERSGIDPPFGPIRRSQTYDEAYTPRRHTLEYNVDNNHHDYDDEDYDDYDDDGRHYTTDRRHSGEDSRSVASSRRSWRSYHTRRSNSTRKESRAGGGRAKTGQALTENNLKTLSEVSSQPPSEAPDSQNRSPYPEGASRDMMLSRPTLQHAATTPVAHRTRSNSTGGDSDLAYGSVPPDLAHREDLGPLATKNEPVPDEEEEARTLIQKIENVLLEAECLHFSATQIITQLQGNPEAAAAVALTLAELSALLGKMSPAFLGVVKGGFPAVFGLLACPQFLIAAGVTVGVTVVMFGGWKIIKHMKEQQALKNASAQPVAAEPAPSQQQTTQASGPQTGGSVYDEALVIEEEVSGIESWRRGIAPMSANEAADMELISPEAERAMRREQRRRDGKPSRSDEDLNDTASRRTGRSKSTRKPSKPQKEKTRKTHSDGEEEDVATTRPRRDSLGRKPSKRNEEDSRSDANNTRSLRTPRAKHGEKVALRTIEEGKSADEGDSLESVLRSKSTKNTNMIKSLFKKKDKSEKTSREHRVSVMV